MTSKIDIAKKKLELSKVKCAKEEMELRIFEREEEIARLKENIENQDKRIKELNDAIDCI
jgi:hypothetical protein